MKVLWRISVKTAAEAEEAVMALMEGFFRQPVTSYTDVERGQSTVSIYFESRPEWSRSRRALLAEGLERIRSRGLSTASGNIRLKELRHEDWAETWKRHFKPIVVGSALLIKPSWSRRQGRKGQATVLLDPGLSFGTGQHPTTGFCLRQLVRQRKHGQAQALLDIGTGSGILAIAAAKLGFGPVHAFDFDRDAVRVARANARRNGVSRKIQIEHADVTRLSRQRTKKYSMICANLTAEPLLSAVERICARIEDGGVLVIAGVLRTEFARVKSVYERSGLRLQDSCAEREWRSGSFVCLATHSGRAGHSLCAAG